MARKLKSDADVADGVEYAKALSDLQVVLNTPNHINSASRAAFEILSDTFNMATAAMAAQAPGEFHHVYEPQEIGNPLMQLWKNQLNGRGRDREVTWTWRASKKLIDPTLTATGEQKFRNAPSWFEEGRLNKIHAFVWKAPIMEYGTEVTIRPKLSRNLVFPNPNLTAVLDSGARGARSVVFTPHPYTVTPGKEVQGNFTAWFNTWWAGGPAQSIIDGAFSERRDLYFRNAYLRRTAHLSKGKNATKSMTFRPMPSRAKQTSSIALLIAGDLEREYIKMAAGRKRMMEGG